MWHMRSLLGCITLALVCGGCDGRGEGAIDTADAVFYNGRIYTQDEAQPWVQALGVKDGRIVFVGSDADGQKQIGADTQVVDLQGRFVMPGIQDAHLHTQMVAEFAQNLTVDPALAWPEIAERIAAYAAQHPDKNWILGGNLPWLTDTIGDDSALAHKSTLDEISVDKAIALWDVGGHAMLANSRALALVGIGADTPDPVGGTIERDANGAATGVLRELATNLILENTLMSVDRYVAGIRPALQRLSSVGITAINEVWANPVTLQAFKQLDEMTALDVRVVTSIAHPVEFTTPAAKAAARRAIEDRAQFDGQRVQSRYVKFVLDGSAGGQTLVLTEPYIGTDYRGTLRNPADVVMQEVSRLQGLGIGSVLHAVGDGAVRLALDAIEKARADHGDNGVRHVIAHTVFVNPADLDRFAELDVIAEFSPYFWAPNEGQQILHEELGEHRMSWAFPVSEMLGRGVPMAAGSDWPVVFDPNPFPAIETMVTREVPGGSEQSFVKAHAVALADAVRIFTSGGAYALYQEDSTGTLAPGKYADFIVLDQNLFEVPIHAVHKTQVALTIVGGDIVYDADKAGEQNE